MKKILGLLVIVIMMTGCMSYNIKMDIKNDKSMDFNVQMELDMMQFAKIALMDEDVWNNYNASLCENMCEEGQDDCVNSCMSSSNNKPTDEDVKKYLDEYLNSGEFEKDYSYDEDAEKKLKEKGYKIEEVMDKENYVYRLSLAKHFNNIDDISSEKEISLDISKLVDGEAEELFFTKTQDGNYKANFIIEEDSDEENEYLMDADLSSILKYDYTVILPYEAISSNATEVSSDKKTLKWNLTGDNIKAVQYEFNLKDNKKNIINLDNDNLKYVAYGLIGGGLLVLGLAILGLIKSKAN